MVTKTTKIIILSSFTLMFLVVACRDLNHKISKKPLIVVSIIPYKYFVEKIVGDLWDVKAMIPIGADHSSYEPTAKDLKMLSQAKVYFESSNLSFEDAWTVRFRNISKKCSFINLSEGVHLIGGHYHNNEYHGADPHYWLSPSEAAIIAGNIKTAIIKIDTSNSDYYNKKYNELIDEINTVDENIKRMLNHLSCKKILVYHPALTYFAAYYGLEQIAIEREGKEPSASYMAYIIDVAKNNNIHTIYYQVQYVGQSVKVIAKEINANTVCYNPLAYDWKENMYEIAENILNNE